MKQKTQIVLAFIAGALLAFAAGISIAQRLDPLAKVYELDFGNGRIHNVATYQGGMWLMLPMEPGAVSVYDLPKRKKKGK